MHEPHTAMLKVRRQLYSVLSGDVMPRRNSSTCASASPTVHKQPATSALVRKGASVSACVYFSYNEMICSFVVSARLGVGGGAAASASAAPGRTAFRIVSLSDDAGAAPAPPSPAATSAAPASAEGAPAGGTPSGGAGSTGEGLLVHSLRRAGGGCARERSSRAAAGKPRRSMAPVVRHATTGDATPKLYRGRYALLLYLYGYNCTRGS